MLPFVIAHELGHAYGLPSGTVQQLRQSEVDDPLDEWERDHTDEFCGERRERKLSNLNWSWLISEETATDKLLLLSGDSGGRRSRRTFPGKGDPSIWETAQGLQFAPSTTHATRRSGGRQACHQVAQSLCSSLDQLPKVALDSL